jgi:hypothetical protein
VNSPATIRPAGRLANRMLDTARSFTDYIHGQKQISSGRWHTPRYPVACMGLRRNAGNQAFYSLYDGLELAYKQSQPALSAPRAGLGARLPHKMGAL